MITFVDTNDLPNDDTGDLAGPVAPGADLLDLARRHAARPADWPLAPRFDPRERWYHRLAAAAGHEIWLLTWLPGQGTDLHDHGGCAGAFVVVSGQLTEAIVTTPPGTDRARLVGTVLARGGGRRFGTRHIHQITNSGTRPAVSVHAYRPALKTMTRYRLDTGTLRVAAVDRAGAQW